LEKQHKLILLLSGSLLFLYLFGSGSLPFLGPDEPRYAQVARQMLESRDWIVPYLGPFPWFEKPILLYWLMGLSYAVFGVSEFAARIPSALAALASVYVLYRVIVRSSGSQTAILASLILGTSAFFVVFSHAASFDMVFTFFVTASLCSFLEFELQPEKSSALYRTYFWAGGGILAKGFVALPLIALPILAYLILSNGWKQIASLKIPTGILIMIAVSGIWFVPISLIYGWRFWDFFFYQHHVLRYTTTTFHKAVAWWFYIPILVLGTYPWTFAPFTGLRNLEAKTDKILVRFSLCWFFVIVLFFSLSRSKLPDYVLPAIPAFAILSAVGLMRNHSTRSVLARFGIFNLIVMGAILVAHKRVPISSGLLIALSLIPVSVTAISLLLFTKRKMIAALALYACLSVATGIFAIVVVAPKLNLDESKRLSLGVKPQLGDDHKLVVYNVYDFAPVFYTNARTLLTPESYLYTLKKDSDLYKFLKRNGRGYVLVRNHDLPWITTSRLWKTQQTWEGREKSVVLLSTQ
jgi:4-amino-4-deoxy-L-arabinose transferase-like glycosyltransferase